MDLDSTTLFGNATIALASLPYRDLRSKDYKSNTKYIQSVTSHLHNNNFYDNMQTLMKERDDELAERLDKILSQACLHGEKQCRPRISLWWSKKLTQARLYRNFLYRALCGFRNNIDVRPAVQARMLSLNVHFEIPDTKESCNTAFKAANQELKQLAKDHLTLRLNEMEERVEMHALAKNKDKAKIVKEMKNQETIAATFRKIRSITRPTHSRGFTSIDIPTSWPDPTDDITSTTSLPNPKLTTTWRTTEIPQDVLHYLRLRNRLHFGQAEGTPLTLPPFSTQLDWAASTSTADLILEGDYTNDELTDIQELMINHCARQGPLDAIPAEITVKEFESRFRTWDKRTSTAPSGIHLGHYKALIRPNDANSTTD